MFEEPSTVFPEGTLDSALFSYAAEQKRVFVTNDNRLPATGERWLEEGKTFTGLIVWEFRTSLVRRIEAPRSHRVTACDDLKGELIGR